jgi:hypothetical protein
MDSAGFRIPPMACAFSSSLMFLLVLGRGPASCSGICRTAPLAQSPGAGSAELAVSVALRFPH